jgi:uncharacterized protein YgiM (DUF1202 family)
MKINKFCRSLTFITVIVLMFTVFAAFCVESRTEVYASSAVTMNINGTVNDGPLNVRSGPGTEYDKMGTVPKGKKIKVISKQTNAKGEVWYKFHYNSKNKGYIISTYVNLNETFATDKVKAFKRKAIVKSKTLKVRAGAGALYPQKGTLKKNEVIYIKSKITKHTGKVWYRFSYKGGNGYINGQYITVTKIVSETDMERIAVIKEGPLNVRSGPGTGYESVRTIADGSKVQILEQKTVGSMTWGRTSDGWISMKFVVLDAAVPSTPTTPTITRSIPLFGSWKI